MRLRDRTCVWLTYAISIGCQEGAAPLVTACAQAQNLECGGGVYCPRGTSCDEGEMAHVCRIEDGAASANALTLGFNVSEFLLTRSPEAAGLFEVRIPRAAEIINCALFICSPSVWPQGAGTAIDNFAECAYANRVLDVRDFGEGERVAQLELNTLQRPEPKAGACEAEPDYGAQPTVPIVSSLQLGCWAFDDRSVIRATRLVDLAPTDLPQFARLPVRDCSSSAADTQHRLCITHAAGVCYGGTCVEESSDAGRPESADSLCSPATEGARCSPAGQLGSCAEGVCVARSPDENASSFTSLPLVIGDCAADDVLTDGHNCYPNPFGGYGTCRDGQCRPRCIEPEDCLRGGNTGDTIGRCTWGPRQRLGLCIPEGESAG
jgi:hypothetical protein